MHLQSSDNPKIAALETSRDRIVFGPGHEKTPLYSPLHHHIDQTNTQPKIGGACLPKTNLGLLVVIFAEVLCIHGFI